MCVYIVKVKVSQTRPPRIEQRELPESEHMLIKSVEKADTLLDKDVTKLLVQAQPRHVVLLSAVPKEAWTPEQRLCFNNKKGKQDTYIDARCVFPPQGSADQEPEPLPLAPEDILKLAVKKAKEQPVLFYGKSSVYESLDAWPEAVYSVADNIKSYGPVFFESLMHATSGFYSLEADKEEDLALTRGVDYRNVQPKGICLILACPFANKSQYLQAPGRVKRNTDQGVIYALQESMWEQDN